MKILGYTYAVINNPRENMLGHFGLFHPESQKIRIADDLCEQQIISTVLHEIVEALSYHLELRLEHNVIMSLEAGLYQVLSENGVDLTPISREVLHK